MGFDTKRIGGYALLNEPMFDGFRPLTGQLQGGLRALRFIMVGKPMQNNRGFGALFGPFPKRDDPSPFRGKRAMIECCAAGFESNSTDLPSTGLKAARGGSIQQHFVHEPFDRACLDHPIMNGNRNDLGRNRLRRG